MNDEIRKAHIEEYGSFLHCPERSVLCEFIDGHWDTGCGREGCILDDPEYQALKKKQEANRLRWERLAEERREQEAKDPPQRIRTQNKYPEDRIWDQIHRLEEESRIAYESNRPKVGERKLHEAIVLRRKLRRQTG